MILTVITLIPWSQNSHFAAKTFLGMRVSRRTLISWKDEAGKQIFGRHGSGSNAIKSGVLGEARRSREEGSSGVPFASLTPIPPIVCFVLLRRTRIQRVPPALHAAGGQPPLRPSFRCSCSFLLSVQGLQKYRPPCTLNFHISLITNLL